MFCYGRAVYSQYGGSDILVHIAYVVIIDMPNRGGRDMYTIITIMYIDILLAIAYT